MTLKVRTTVDSTPWLNSATATHVAAQTRQPNKPCLRTLLPHHRELGLVGVLGLDIAAPVQQLRWPSRTYTSFTCSATSLDRGVPTLSQCGPGSSSIARWKKHQLSRCGSSSVDAAWKNVVKTARRTATVSPVDHTGCFLCGFVGETSGGAFGKLNKVDTAHHMFPAVLLSLFLNCDSSE